MANALQRFELRRSAALCVTTYQQPAFALIGNPAALFGHLLQHLAPFGATLGSLSMDTTNLPSAYVSCTVSPSLVARVKVSECDVFARPSDVGTDVAIAFAEAAWSAISATDPEQRISKRTLTLNLWGRATGQTFAEMSSAFVRSLEEGASATSIAWKASDFEFAIEEASDDPGGVFVRVETSLTGDAPLSSIAPLFKSRARGLLAAVGLEAPESLK